MQSILYISCRCILPTFHVNKTFLLLTHDTEEDYTLINRSGIMRNQIRVKFVNFGWFLPIYIEHAQQGLCIPCLLIIQNKKPGAKIQLNIAEDIYCFFFFFVLLFLYCFPFCESIKYVLQISIIIIYVVQKSIADTVIKDRAEQPFIILGRTKVLILVADLSCKTFWN